MKFGVVRWIICFYLDVAIKALLFIYFGLLVTLNNASVIGLILGALLLSIFHFACLFLAIAFLALLRRPHLELSRAIGFLPTLIVANIFFVLGFAALLGLNHQSGEALSAFGESLAMGTVVAISNLPPILMVAGLGRLLSLARKRSVNTAVPGHMLHPGNVHRSIVQDGDDLYVQTQGYGTGIFLGRMSLEDRAGSNQT